MVISTVVTISDGENSRNLRITSADGAHGSFEVQGDEGDWIGVLETKVISAARLAGRLVNVSGRPEILVDVDGFLATD